MSIHDVRLFGDQVAASRLAEQFSTVRATSLLRLAIEDLFPGKIALVSSFGADSAVLLHMVAQIDRSTPVVFIDTGQLFAETLAYRDTLVDLFGLTDVRAIGPDAQVLAAEDPEAFLWSNDPDRCCEIRKVAPLAGAIEGFDAWITGRKQFQASTRAALPLFEAEGERMKVNPLAGWTATDVLAYLKQQDLPPHPMVAKGFPSIGCMPCTKSRPPGRGLAGRALARQGQGRVRHPPRDAGGGVEHLRGAGGRRPRRPGSSSCGRTAPGGTLACQARSEQGLGLLLRQKRRQGVKAALACRGKFSPEILEKGRSRNVQDQRNGTELSGSDPSLP